MNAHATAAAATLVKAVCYKCSYVGIGATAPRCPHCGFPIILETCDATDALAPSIESVFDRVSVSVGAPPLPGVDDRPRKAQLLMEARKKRIERRRTTQREQRAMTEQHQRQRRRRSLAAVFAVSAVLAGAVTAILINGAL